jgi:hypothetical protein
MRAKYNIRETLSFCHPGEKQHGHRKARFTLSIILNALPALKVAGPPTPREALNESALP